MRRPRSPPYLTSIRRLPASLPRNEPLVPATSDVPSTAPSGDAGNLRWAGNLADRPLVRTDRPLRGDLLLRGGASRAQVPAREDDGADRLPRRAREARGPDRGHTLVDSPARPARRARPLARLLRLRRPLHRNGDPGLPGRLCEPGPKLRLLPRL